MTVPIERGRPEGRSLRTAGQRGVAVLADQAVFSATRLLTGVIIGRACSQDQLGFYLLGLSVIILVSGVQRSLISTPYTVFCQRLKSTELAQYTGSALLCHLALSAVFTVCLGMASIGLHLAAAPRGLVIVLSALAAVVTLVLLRDFVRYVLFARLRFAAAFVLDTLVSLLQLGVLSTLAFRGRLSAGSAVWVIGVSAGAVSLAVLMYGRGRFEFSRTAAAETFRRHWAFGRWLFAGSMFYLLSWQLYPWLLTFFHGAAVTGVFAACTGVLGMLNPLLLGMQNYLSPVTARAALQGPTRLNAVVWKATAVLCVAIGLWCLAVLVLGDIPVVLLYGEKFRGSAPALRVLSFNLLAAALGSAPMYGLLAMERPGLNLLASLGGLVATLLLGPLLVKYFGLLGAAYAALFSSVIVMGVRWTAFRIVLRPHAAP